MKRRPLQIGKQRHILISRVSVEEQAKKALKKEVRLALNEEIIKKNHDEDMAELDRLKLADAAKEADDELRRRSKTGAGS